MFAETMHMKFRQLGKRLLSAAAIAGAALTVASCAPGNTVDFLYVTSNRSNPGQINAYFVDSLNGALHQIPDSPYPSGGRNPVYEVASPSGKYLYVANHDDNTIVMFAIGTDAKLYPLQTVNTPGTEPVAMAMDPSGTMLYVLDYYAPAAPGQPSYTDLNPGPGAVIAYPLNSSNGTLGTPLAVGARDFWGVQCFPTNITITPDGNYLYVTNTNAVVVTTSPPVTGTVPTLPASCPSSGTLSGFAVLASGSSSSRSITGLTPITGSPFSIAAGSEPTGITADLSSTAIYVTDSSLNQLYAYTIQPGGILALADTVATGTMPMNASVVGSSGPYSKFLYVSNYTDGSISIYSLAAGIPTQVATSSSGASGPLCLVADPRLSRYFYTADYTGGTVAGAQLDPSTGTLITTQGSPYPTAGQPTCVAAVPHNRGNPNGE